MKTVYEDYNNGLRYELFPICPKCRGEIYWRSYRSTMVIHEDDAPIREEIVAHCQNSSLAYRSIQQMTTNFLCEWRGKVDTSEHGDLIIRNFDGSTVPYRIYKTNLRGFGVDYNVRFVV